ncbi:MerR family transcriptional regulator [Paenibacillus ferrarius]|uniref:MerR family transcriptional regulator n=1 Tax=Paenibacillus ferrarius TaxID=1469647 RepID=A0A1V4HML0_9BACL|nr:MerR family transcriptional regulator [Paenibacillus ferrarius]OPH58365.1 MerR family transcriptional regulator [Paenibacillus ferrarius]
MGFTIGDVAEQTGLSMHTLRYYENEGIVPNVKRNEGGTRIYEQKDIEWLEFVCCLRNTGMTIAELKGFVGLVLQGHETIDERMRMLDRQMERIQTQIDQLTVYRTMVDKKMGWYRNYVAKHQA